MPDKKSTRRLNDLQMEKVIWHMTPVFQKDEFHEGGFIKLELTLSLTN